MASCPCAALLKLLLITILIYICIYTCVLIYYTYFCKFVVNPINSKNCHKYAMTGNKTELVCFFISATRFDLTVSRHRALQFV